MDGAPVFIGRLSRRLAYAIDVLVWPGQSRGEAFRDNNGRPVLILAKTIKTRVAKASICFYLVL
jgi:hypothetical protein